MPSVRRRTVFGLWNEGSSAVSRFAGKETVELALEADALQKEIAKRQLTEQRAINRKFVGKAFASRESHLVTNYLFITGLTDNGDLRAVWFYRGTDGDIWVRTVTTYPHLLGKPITRKKWNTEALGIITDIRGMLGIGGFAQEQTVQPRKAKPKCKKTRGRNVRQSD